MRFWALGVPLLFVGGATSGNGWPSPRTEAPAATSVIEGRLLTAIHRVPIAGGFVAFDGVGTDSAMTDSAGRFALRVPKGVNGAFRAWSKDRRDLRIPSFGITTDSVHAQIELRLDPPELMQIPSGRYVTPLLWIVFEAADRVDVYNNTSLDRASMSAAYVTHIVKWNPWFAGDWYGSAMLEGGVAVSTRLAGPPRPRSGGE